jgi:GAF domain-containing protein
LAGSLDVSLNEPRLASRLHDTTADLRERPGLAAVLPTLLEDALSLTGAEVGNIQLLDPRDGSLVLVTHRGFGPAFLDHFAVVNDGGSVCGRAASKGSQAVVPDVREDLGCIPHRQVFRAAGVRAVQSTPLVDRTGRMLGMISTHWPQPAEPGERDLRFMELYGHLAGDVVARHLARASGDGSKAATPRSVSREAALAQLLNDAVNGILDAGLSFAAAQALATDDLLAQQLRAGVGRLDDILLAIQLAMYELDTP